MNLNYLEFYKLALCKTNIRTFIYIIEMSFNQGNFRGNSKFRGQRKQPYQNYNNRNFDNNGYKNSRNFQKPSANPSASFMKKKDEENNTVNRLRDITMLSYMERRNLKGIMGGNPRFHLVGFNGVPKYVKTSVFLTDMTLHIPEIKPKNLVSIHSSINNANNQALDYQIGFNTVKIIKRLEEIFGTGYIDLYKATVQTVMPDIESNSNCEFNKVVNDAMTTNKQPYKLTHKDMNLIKIIELLEDICGDKFQYISAICCTGETTYINIEYSALVLMLSNASTTRDFKIDPCDTVALTGVIPSEMLPSENLETPVNSTDTARMSPEEIIKFSGFKKIFEKFSKNQKDAEINMIKGSLRETQGNIQSSLREIEMKIDEKFVPMETKFNAVYSRMNEIMSTMLENQKTIVDTQQQIMIKMETIAKRSSKKIIPTTATSVNLSSTAALATSTSSSINPSTYGRIEYDNELNMALLEKEIDMTPKE